LELETLKGRILDMPINIDSHRISKEKDSQENESKRTENQRPTLFDASTKGGHGHRLFLDLIRDQPQVVIEHELVP
jgi:hypothetical protein